MSTCAKRRTVKGNASQVHRFAQHVRRLGWRVAAVSRYLFEPGMVLVTIETDDPNAKIPV